MTSEEILTLFKGNKKLASMVIAMLEQARPPLIKGHFTTKYYTTNEGGLFIQTGSFVGSDFKKYGIWIFNTALVVTGLFYTVLTYYQSKPAQEKKPPQSKESMIQQIENTDSPKNRIPLPIKDSLRTLKVPNPKDSIAK